MTSKLAIHGGEPIRRSPFPGNDVIGKEEREAVLRVLDSKILSGFYGSWDEKFYGGAEVKACEAEWSEYFGAKHAITVNSATSGLQCAAGAVGLGPGDEVIVSPFSMCASATVPLLYGAIPVFADIEDNYFCIDPDSVRTKITPRTKAILGVDIFGHPFESKKLLEIAKEHNLILIEDAAQAPGASDNGKYAATLGHIGVFSLNYHKHIHSGEGGVVITNDDSLAERVRMIRNHAEAVVGPKKEKNLVNMLGFNFRMTELEASIARSQLKKLKTLLAERKDRISYLNQKLSQIPGITPPEVRKGCEHVHYLHAIKFDESKVGVSRDVFVEAICAELPPMALKEDEGVCLWSGYVQPLYMLPIFQQKICFGSDGFPWNSAAPVSYEKGLCPVVERMYEKELIVHEYITPFMSRKDLDDLVAAFEKVYEGKASLR